MKNRMAGLFLVPTLGMALWMALSVEAYEEEKSFRVQAPEDPGEYALEVNTLEM